MRILILSLWPERGREGLSGAPDQALLLEAAERRGWEVVLWHRFWVPKSKLGLLALPLSFALNNLKLALKSPPKVNCVLAMSGHLAPGAQSLARKLGVSLIVKQHGLREFLQGGFLNRLRCYDSWLALRARAKKILVEDGSGASLLKPDLLVLPARRGVYYDMPREAAACFVGRLNKVKGAHLLLKMARLVDPRRVWVLGRGPLEPRLREAGFRILGSLNWEEVPAVLARCRAVLGLNPYGNLTLPVVEGAEQGAVPVVLDRGTTARFLRGGAVLAEDWPEVARWVNRLLEDEGLWQELSARAKAKALEFPTWEERLGEELDFIERVCSRGS